jgi:phosphoserine phosphatase RsbU/P
VDMISVRRSIMHITTDNGVTEVAGAHQGQSVVQQENERVVRMILEYAAKISTQNEISELIRLNADLARNLVGAERCSLWLLDEQAGELWTRVADATQEIRIQSREGIVGACVARNETVFVNNVESDPRFFREIDQTRGYHTRSIACVPLRAEGKVIGAMQLLNRPGGFSAVDSELLQFMAVYAAAAIQAECLRQEADAARLLRREIEIAGQVQHKLFPRDLGQFKGLEYCGFCRPARFVSGDFYDFQALPGGALGFSLGDVSGKGFPAAILMASIQTLLHSLLQSNPGEPGQVLSALNDAVNRICAPEHYSTLFCGVLNPERNLLTYANAGHPPPLLVRQKDGHIARPQEGGIPVGLLPAIRYERHTVCLDSGDLIICASDGLFEVQNRTGELWEDSTIETTIREYRNKPLENITEALMHAVAVYAAGAEQFDDITIILLRIGELSRSLGS